MDRMLYLAMTGAKHAMLAQQTNANNLANVNTTGFRADLDSFMSVPVKGAGYDDRTYAVDTRAGSNMDAGSLIHTGRELDIAINGEGWIAVQSRNGSEAYTRRGDLQVSSLGILQTGDGLPVIGNGGPIAIPPAQKLEIGRDGTVSFVPLGQDPNTLVVLDRIKLVKPGLDQVEKSDDGLFRLTNGQIAEPDAEVGVASGTLESSNVNQVDALVKMINYARAFEMHMKVISAANKNDESSATLLRTS
jgi:flagellar basal-body rod protein FlgF